MANVNNLIRPSILSAEACRQRIRRQEEQELNRNMVENIDRAALAATVSEILAQQLPGLLRRHNSSEEFANVTDQVIAPEHAGNLGDLDRVPDIVKTIRDFSGDPSEFSSWKKGVDRILEAYSAYQGTPKYYGILHTIRNKIVGHADMALESYNTPLNWLAISKCLTLHYADKRDINTLEYQMTMLIQGANQSVEEFHQTVYKHLSLILNKIGCMGLGREAELLMTKMYRDKALDTFVRGLQGDLPRLLGIKEPVDLPSALHLCLKLENQNFRARHATNMGQTRQFRNQTANAKPSPAPRSTSFINRQPPIPPPRTQYYQIGQQPPTTLPRQNSNNFGYQLAQPAAAPRPFQNRQLPPQLSAPPRPQAPKPLPRPEPMDVDPSVQTRMVNYMNRPRFEPGKRPPGPIPDGMKRQRNFNIQTTTEENETRPTETPLTMTDYEQAMAEYEDYNNLDDNLDDYVDQIDEADADNNSYDYYDDAALNFLE